MHHRSVIYIPPKYDFKSDNHNNNNDLLAPFEEIVNSTTLYMLHFFWDKNLRENLRMFKYYRIGKISTISLLYIRSDTADDHYGVYLCIIGSIWCHFELTII